MGLAVLTAQRATCARRRVGCVLLNHRGHVLSTGFNGVASGQPHCNHEVIRTDGRHEMVFRPHVCQGAGAKSGTNLDACQAIHAEQNALLQCRDIYDIETAFVTASPCVTCVKLLMNTGCQRVVYLEEYPHNASRDMWILSGRKWEKMDTDETNRLRIDLSGI